MKKKKLDQVFKKDAKGYPKIEEEALLKGLAAAYQQIVEGEADKGVDADEAMKRHGIKKHEGDFKVKKLKRREKRKGEGLGVKPAINRAGFKAEPGGGVKRAQDGDQKAGGPPLRGN